MMRFTLPRDIYYGKDSLEVLKTVKGKKAILVIGGGSMKRAGFVDKIIGYLKEAGIETKLFEGVEPDPSVETVMKGAAAMRESLERKLNLLLFLQHQVLQKKLLHSL